MTHNLESSEKSLLPIQRTKHTAGLQKPYLGAIGVCLKYSLLSYLFNNIVLLLRSISTTAKKKNILRVNFENIARGFGPNLWYDNLFWSQ